MAFQIYWPWPWQWSPPLTPCRIWWEKRRKSCWGRKRSLRERNSSLIWEDCLDFSRWLEQDSSQYLNPPSPVCSLSGRKFYNWINWINSKIYYFDHLPSSITYVIILVQFLMSTSAPSQESFVNRNESRFSAWIPWRICIIYSLYLHFPLYLHITHILATLCRSTIWSTDQRKPLTEINVYSLLRSISFIQFPGSHISYQGSQIIIVQDIWQHCTSLGH